MAFFKCKMCGGDLDISAGMSIAECQYCGTKQTLPKLDDDKKATLYDRANHFRRNNEFDKAMGIYEQILNEDSSDAEAYWSLVLCRYGIEYVEDPASRKRIPTVNRAQFTSIFDDENYKSALQYADGYQRSIYEEEAKAINEIQKGILAISQQEEPFDVFICYKETDANGRRTPDSVLANDLYHQLTQEGFKVFFARITLEDKLGAAYEPYIFAALNSAKVMVVLGTKPDYFNAVWVRNEWSRYLSLIKSGAKKMLIPAYKDMDPYDLPEEFAHLQSQDMSKLGFMQDLIRGIKKIASVDEPKTVVRETVIHENKADIESLLKRAFIFLEDGSWKEAEQYCDKVLDADPENAHAYMGKLMAETRTNKEESLGTRPLDFSVMQNYKKAWRYADESFKSTLENYCRKAKAKFDEVTAAKEQAQIEAAIETHNKNLQDITTKGGTFFILKSFFILMFTIPISIAVLMISRGWTDGWEIAPLIFGIIASIVLFLFARSALNNVRYLKHQDDTLINDLKNKEQHSLESPTIEHIMFSKYDIIPIILPSVLVCISHFLAEWLDVLMDFDYTSRVEENFVVVGFLIGFVIALITVVIRNKKAAK